ncbi:type I-E CRISPR-associated protein Cas7/Cse4/CasC [Streptomyces sp. NPDC050560]|uniref:type I-E CRISPR-associated protein Cas7/Cse4/CasC n=1 Tax=Streptomyces sp. NPDC050560 TaxID=3365630 RepID=UPI0037AF1784
MTSRLYVDMHVIQSLPPANANRDDQGNPKEAIFGGVRRSRVSSQAWKRATRKHFDEHAPEADRATRTKRVRGELTKRIATSTQIGDEQAGRLANALLGQLGLSQGKKADDTAYLLFYGNAQLDAVTALLTSENTPAELTDAGALALLDDATLTEKVKRLPVVETFKRGHPLGVALFGRMVANLPTLHVDAAVQVAHALSTHETELEFDYFTAVDDRNEKEETGAGMIGSIGFNSATLYRYATVGVEQLIANLGGDTEAAVNAVTTLVDSFARSAPTGYQNAFAHRTRPTLIAVVARADQPVNLVSAFETPVPAQAGISALSALRLAEEHREAVRMWGDAPLHTAVSHSFRAADSHTKDTVEALAGAFGEPVAFPQLLDGLRTRLTTVIEEAQ